MEDLNIEWRLNPDKKTEKGHADKPPLGPLNERTGGRGGGS